MRKNLFFIVILLWLFCPPTLYTIEAQNTTNAEQAKAIFNRTYELVFGPQGSALHYDVNIIGIYKTYGDICYKGKKMRYVESRYASWNDGVTAYMVDKKTKTVSIYKADSDKKDAYLSKFKYNLDEFEYSWSKVKENYLVSIKMKHAGLTGIREVRGVIDPDTFYPINVRIKVAFFWTTVNISNFKSGNISDHNFVFPRENYKDYKFVDKQDEN